MTFRMRLWERPHKPMQRPNRDKALARITMELTAIIEAAPGAFPKLGRPDPVDREAQREAKQAVTDLCALIRELWKTPEARGWEPMTDEIRAAIDTPPSPGAFVYTVDETGKPVRIDSGWQLGSWQEPADEEKS